MVHQPKARESVVILKAVMIVGCWIARTRLTTGTVSVLMHELKRFRWDGTSPVSLKRTEGIGWHPFRILSSEREDYHRSGVALILSSLGEKALLWYNPVNDRIITTRFKTAVGCMTIFQVYAPTTNADDEEMASSQDKLQKITVCDYCPRYSRNKAFS